MTTPCYIFDIDGTLADCGHRLVHIQKQAKDWPSFFAVCHLDKPIPHMVHLAQAIDDAMETIIFVSGRSDECRAATEAWLSKHINLFYPPRVFMRRAGDHRDDDIVKMELLAEVRAAGFEPIMVFDDRNRVVQAWRAAGIPCAQVAEGDF